MHRLLAALLLLLMPVEARAQQVLGHYFARLGPQDMVNSSGARLTDFSAILQQDRANYHRFNRRDPDDTGDAFFASAAARAQIGRLCRVAPGNDYIPREVLRGVPRYVHVRILGSGGRIIAIEVSEGAG